MTIKECDILKAKKPIGNQHTFYCPYCSRTNLLFLWHNNRLIGIGLDRWLYCPKCERKFKMSIRGISEQELNIRVEV